MRGFVHVARAGVSSRDCTALAPDMGLFATITVIEGFCTLFAALKLKTKRTRLEGGDFDGELFTQKCQPESKLDRVEGHILSGFCVAAKSPTSS